MGWERKRGKLLDLNKLLVGEFDAFPIKAGRLDMLPQVRYMLTLDSDTQLPRGTAAAMVGAIAHPLNQAIIDPKRRIVDRGLRNSAAARRRQRQSAARSRLAAIYSGQTGFDIYTRAVSDAYQDLYGEGIFTGKGIYEVATLHAVLEQALPAQCAAEPRSDRRRLRPRRAGHRYRSDRRLSVALQRLHPAQASLGARRLADRAMDVLARARRVGPLVPQSDLDHFALEDLRQSAPLAGRAVHVHPVSGGLVCLPGGPLYWTVVTLLLFFFPTIVQFIFSVGRAW